MMHDMYVIAEMLTLVLWVFAFLVIYFAVFLPLLPRSRSYTPESYALFCKAAQSCAIGAVVVALVQPYDAHVHAELAPFDGGSVAIRVAVAVVGLAVAAYAFVRRRALSAD